MIDTSKYEGYTEGEREIRENGFIYIKGQDFHAGMAGAFTTADAHLIADAPKLLAEIKRLQKENKILAKYRDIVQKYDDALLADGDTDPRWSELYE
mgnify:CR=1 FL=1|jgi:hypothetical protein